MDTLKGFWMGICDVIPGISGATFALIFGIYERLILQASTLVSGDGSILVRLRSLEYGFLMRVGIGVGMGIVAGSFFITFLLDRYASGMYAFFALIILLSAFSLLKGVWTASSVPFYMLAGLVGIGIGFLGVGDTITYAGPLLLIMAGFLASIAMMLPGVSGSYILLLIGMYPLIVSLVRDSMIGLIALDVSAAGYLMVFGIGVVLGIASLARILGGLLTSSRSLTIGVLASFMLGSTLIPVQQMLSSFVMTHVLVGGMIGLLAGFVLMRQG